MRIYYLLISLLLALPLLRIPRKDPYAPVRMEREDNETADDMLGKYHLMAKINLRRSEQNLQPLDENMKLFCAANKTVQQTAKKKPHPSFKEIKNISEASLRSCGWFHPIRMTFSCGAHTPDEAFSLWTTDQLDSVFDPNATMMGCDAKGKQWVCFLSTNLG